MPTTLPTAFSTIIRRYTTEISLILLTLLTRIPVVSHYLYSWDAAQLSLAMEYFDMQQHRPHPPGYIIYVALGKITNFFIHNANTTYVTLSILAMIATVLLGYHFALLLTTRRPTRRRFALIVALLLIVNPYMWFYSEVAATYIFDSLFAALFAYLTLRIIKHHNPRTLLWFTLFLALSGGIRQTLIILFAPLYLFALAYLLVRKKIRLGDVALHALVGAAAITLWLLPLLALSGGPAQYFQTASYHFHSVGSGTSIFQDATWAVTWGQAKDVAKTSLVALNVLLLAPLLLLLRSPRWLKNWSSQQSSQQNSRQVRRRDIWHRHILRNPLVYLFALLLVPSFFVYIFMHFGNPGYISSVAPTLVILFALPLLLYPPRWQILFGALAILAFLTTFLFYDSPFLKSYTLGAKIAQRVNRADNWFAYHTRAKVKSISDDFGIHIEAARAYDPATTVLLTEKGFNYRLPKSEVWVRNGVDYFRHIEYYLPQYDVYELFWRDRRYFHVKNNSRLQIQKSTFVPLPPSTETLVIITKDIDRDALAASNITVTLLPDGQKLFTIDMRDRNRIMYAGYTLIKLAAPSIIGTEYADCPFCFQN
ncbi:MAG: hypothetical protein A3F54_01955 [Candidatus Kerfeldbacteria bacterium RIFCSPHIGHO2_12_FULL_48_17]|uniref:Glycosyltransferase RgtA/B/C/D-like domain-containing protein n=1 Tax=Candidatus Kerfeldbacteria bacterium RIFCSPHIGHO2_12_FULL_48_17 TaxID=1798542 RepID=A0A1G2AY11_9BACT|nr:MAG: hypothetical protein A3F54_01955 [Candidatus Kerfeldbacteria bacterium RIFCSPHIGHO2_12_FULL_48_17]